MRILSAVIFVIISAQVSFAGDTDISVSAAWARPTILMNRPGAAYFMLHNRGDVADRLISVSSPMTARIELHVHKHDDGVMRMMQVDSIPIPARSRTEVAPGGYHLMLFGLKKKLNMGDELPLTLTFEHGRAISVTAKVMKKAP